MSLVVASQATEICNVDLIENHLHFTRLTDTNMTRECWFDTTDSSDLFIDLERYSGDKPLDGHAGMNMTLGDLTITIGNSFITLDKHACGVEMKSKLEQTIWLWLHFESGAMSVQVSPASSTSFGHCFTVPLLAKPLRMRVNAWTQSGLEQVLRGIHTDKPALTDPNNAVVVRKSIHELERRLDVLESRLRNAIEGINRLNQHHLNKHQQHIAQLDELEQARITHTNTHQDHAQKLRQLHHGFSNIGPGWWWWVGALALPIVVVRVWVIGQRQEKLTRFKL